MKAILKKLTSRKFLLAALSMAAGVAALCGADERIVSIISGALMTVLPAVVYCITEGRIDEASAKAITGAVIDASEALGADKQLQNVLSAAGDMLAAAGEDDEQASDE